MGGGLMQLVAYGAQDVYLTGNAQITYFKVVYRRHTNFSMECIEHPIDSARFGGRHTVQVLRNGDLATRMYLRVVLPKITGANVVYAADDFSNTRVAWVRRVGHALVKNIQLTIGGSEIDKVWGTWLDLWYELTHTTEQEKGYRAMIGDVDDLVVPKGAQTSSATEVVLPEYTLYIPLQFWFNRNTGLALPLIALQYHEVRLNIELEEASKLICQSGVAAVTGVSSLALGSCGLMVDYIYLDSEERRRFAQVGHEYLIEQVQFLGEETLVASSSSTSVSQKHKLEFNHPTKEIVWAAKLGAWVAGNDFLTYTGSDSLWGSAVDYAAENIADGMFCLANGTAVPTGNWVACTLSATVATATSRYVTATATGVTDNGLTITVLVNNNSGFRVGTAVGSHGLYVNQRVLTNNSTFLAAKIESVLVTLDVAVGTAADDALIFYEARTATGGKAGAAVLTNSLFLLQSNKVKVVSHNLNLTEVSVPLSDFTDARAHTLVANRVAARDFTVYQHNNYGLRLDGVGNLVSDAQLKLNGHDRFSVQDGPYFNYVQPAQHHTRTPADGVNVYSFGLNPEQHQPSGTANLSRIDTTLLAVTYADNLRGTGTPKMTSLFSNTLVYIFAFSYNVLRIMSGMGGLAYAN
jgi:hypothetical protein